MAKARNIKFTLFSLLIILLLCEVSVADLTFSFVRMEKQSESTEMSQPRLTARSVAECLGKVSSFYSDTTPQSPYGVFESGDTGEIPLLKSSLGAASSSVSSSRAKRPVDIFYENPAISFPKDQKWENRSSGAKKGTSAILRWRGYPLPGEFPGNGPKDDSDVIILDPPIGDSAVVPAPAAISLGCVGLAIVGWLRNRKTF